MEGFAGLVILIFWLCIAGVIRKGNQAAGMKKNNSPKTGGNPARQGSASDQTTSRPAPATQTPLQRTLAPSVGYGSRDDSIYQGSLNAVSTEGYDPCHEADLHGLDEAKAAPATAPVSAEHVLPFGWTGSDMVKGIVISEILKRKG